MNLIRFLIVLLVAAATSGCGQSFSASVRNQTDRALRIELRDAWYGGGQTTWFSATVAPNGCFEYRIDDGWRSEGKYIRVRDANSADPEDWRTNPIGGWTASRFRARLANGTLLLEPE